ncbi:MAG: AAA family ATPase [Candidatus Woesearchaeota archaeon]|nr:AAA family ATPase [Candidatus Woesearchaeota archaeon]
MENTAKSFKAKHKSILITGVAGSGKSAVCKELKKLGFPACDIESVNGLFKMVDRKTGKKATSHNNDSLDSVKQHDWICDKNKLKKLIASNSKCLVFYCGTASNLDDTLSLFEKIFLLKVSSKILCERLSSRTSNAFGRTYKVQKWILSWKKWWEDHMCEKGAIIIPANRSLKLVVADIVKQGKSL